MKSVIPAPAALPRMDSKLVAPQMILWSCLAVPKPVVQALMSLPVVARHPVVRKTPSCVIKAQINLSELHEPQDTIAGVISMTILM